MNSNRDAGYGDEDIKTYCSMCEEEAHIVKVVDIKSPATTHTDEDGNFEDYFEEHWSTYELCEECQDCWIGYLDTKPTTLSS